MIHTKKAIIRHKKLHDSKKFRQLDEVVFTNHYLGYQDLLSITEKVLCDVNNNLPPHIPFYLFHK